jgi:hypothetical protein
MFINFHIFILRKSEIRRKVILMEEIVYHTNYRLENEYWWFVARNEIVKTLILQKTDIPQGSYV